MNSLKNKVVLIGHVGIDPTITNISDGKIVARLSLATNEQYKDANGNKVKNTNWHTVVGWGKIAEIIEKYVKKGKLVAVEGKLVSRYYEDKEGVKRYVSEVVVSEILLLSQDHESTL